MSVEISCKNDCLTARLGGEIDHHSAAEMRMAIDSELSRTMPKLLVLDFGGVTFMDSSGVGLILGRAREQSLRGGRILVANPSPHIRKMLKLSGLAGMIAAANNKPKEEIGNAES